jgi:hypothetical protein
VRSLNASRFCRFYVGAVKVLRTSILPLPGDACWFSRVRIEQRLLLYIVVMPWEVEPSTLLYWKIPCVSACILRCSCSSTTLVLPPSAAAHSLSERSLGWTYLMSTICISYVIDVTCVMPYTYVGLSVLVSTWDPLLIGEHTYIHSWSTSRYETSSKRMLYSPLRLARSSLVAKPLGTGPSGAPPLRFL